MNRVASMPVEKRCVVFSEVAERLQIQPVIVEKDFWVCWALGALRLGRAWNIPARAARGAQDRVGAGLSGDAGHVPRTTGIV